MARNKKSVEPLMKHEVDLIQARHTETVLRAVLRYSEKDVATAVSLARRWLRDEAPDTSVDEMNELLLRDEIDIPDSVLAHNKDARFGKSAESNNILSEQNFLNQSFIPGQYVDDPEPEPAPEPTKERGIPAPRRTPKPAPTPMQRHRSEPEHFLENRPVPVPVSEDDFDFLDQEDEADSPSLLIPDDVDSSSLWDDDPQEDEFIPKREIKESQPRPQVPEPMEEMSFDDLWSAPADNAQIPRKTTASSLMDELGL